MGHRIIKVLMDCEYKLRIHLVDGDIKKVTVIKMVNDEQALTKMMRAERVYSIGDEDLTYTGQTMVDLAYTSDLK